MIFALRLAQSMGMTLHELQTRMSSREFSLHLALALKDIEDSKPKMNAEFEDWFGDF